MTSGPNYFNSKRWHVPAENRYTQNMDAAFRDVTDEYANQGFKLSFQHVATGKVLYAKAFITAYNETFSSDWRQEQIFGRRDPIHMFKQTTRNATLSFKFVAATHGEAFDNMSRLDRLRSYLYPNYEPFDNSGAKTLTQSPLVRIGIFNLLTDGNTAITFGQMFGSSPVARGQGALAIIRNMNVNFNLENPDAGLYESKAATDNVGVPKIIDISIDFTIIHEKNVGHDGWNNDITRGIYGVDLGTQSTRLAPPVPENLVRNEETSPPPQQPVEEEVIEEPAPTRTDPAGSEATDASITADAIASQVQTTPSVEQDGQPGTDALAETIEEDPYVPTPGLEVILAGLPEDLQEAFRNADRNGTAVRLRTAYAHVQDVDLQGLPDDQTGQGAYGDQATSYDIAITPQELVTMYGDPNALVGNVLGYQQGTTIGTGAGWTVIRVQDTRDRATGSRTLANGEVVDGYWIQNSAGDRYWRDVIVPSTASGISMSSFQLHTGTGGYASYRDIVGAYSTSMAGPGVYEIVQ